MPISRPVDDGARDAPRKVTRDEPESLSLAEGGEGKGLGSSVAESAPTRHAGRSPTLFSDGKGGIDYEAVYRSVAKQYPNILKRLARAVKP